MRLTRVALRATLGHKRSAAAPLSAAFASVSITRKHVNTYKQPIIFALLFFAVALIFRAYAVYRTQVDLSILSVLVSCLASGFISGIGFFLGQLKSKEDLLIKHLTFSALFAFLMSHTVSNLAGLYQISWFAYAASVLAFSVVIAIRAPKVFKKEKYS